MNERIRSVRRLLTPALRRLRRTTIPKPPTPVLGFGIGVCLDHRPEAGR